MRVVFLFIFFISGRLVYSQSKYSIRGKITSEVTEQAIANASVYINNTSIGIISNQQGEFFLNSLPAGNQELIISCIGFATKRMIINTGESVPFLNIRLKPKAEELSIVTVEPVEKDGWNKWGDLFRENFIGTSRNAQHCKLRNPEVLRFRLMDKGSKLLVFADEPLKIENRALGYHIQFDLDEFIFDFNTRSVVFDGFSFFKDISTKRPKQLQQWQANRKKSYAGSLHHFMYALYHGDIQSEGFEIFKERRMVNEEKKRVRKLMEDSLGVRILTDSKNGETYIFGNPKKRDSLSYYNRIIKEPDVITDIEWAQTDLNKILVRTQADKKQLYFDDYLRVIYRNEEEEPAYVRFKGQNKGKGYQLSSIKLINDLPLTILPDGRFYEEKNLSLYGYWAWEGIAELMPYDFLADVAGNSY